jgi:hypothetical protein
MADPFTNPFQNLAFPQSSVAARPTPAPTQSAMSPQQQRHRAAFLNALARPDMPIEPQFSTGSAAGDEQAMLRARYARMLDAGRSAVAERAAAQGRSLQTGADGMPVYGDAPATPIVQESPGGVRVAYRNGMPVGFSTPRTLNPEERLFNKQFQTDVAARRRQIETETNALPAAQRASIAARLGVENTSAAIAEALSAGVQNAGSVAATPERGEAIRRQATELAADQSVARMRAAQILRAAGATAPAVAAAQGAPVAVQAAAPAPVPMQTTPAPSESPILPLTEEAIAETDVLERELARQEEAARQVPVETERRVRTEQFVAERARLLRQFEQAVRNGRPDVARRIQQQIQMLGLPTPTMRAPQAAPERPIQQNDFSAFAQALRGLPVLRPGSQPVVEEQVDGETMSRGVAAAAAPSRSPTLPAGLTEAEVVIRPDVLQNPNLSEEEYAAEWKRIFDLQTRLVKKDFPSANSEDERERINSVIKSINDQLLSLAKTRGGPPEGWISVE